MSLKIGFGVNKKQAEQVFVKVSKSAEDLWIKQHELSGKELKDAIAKFEAKKAQAVPDKSAVKLDKLA